MSDRSLSRTALALGAAAALFVSGACQSSSTNVLGPSSSKCAVSVPATLPPVGAAGGTGTLNVNVAAECVWSASSEADWISITSNASGQGPGVVHFTASGNPSASIRRGALLVSDSRVELPQAGAPCQFNLTPLTESFGSDGGDGVVDVSAIDGCQWSAASNAAWLSIVGNASGAGSGSIRYQAAPNSDATRSGTLTIADRTFAVNQSGAGSTCALTVARNEQSAPAIGGTDVVVVSGPGDCAWAATSHAPWIIVTSGASGSGPGAVALSIAPNTGGVRVGLVTIAGRTYIVTQSGAAGTCSYNVGPTSYSAPAEGGAATIAVGSSAGCGWTATSQVPWITIASGNTGNGTGTVTVAIAPNTGAQRTGRVIVAGYTYSVSQAAGEGTACSYTIDASQLSAPAAGATSAVAVTASGHCSWTAASQVSWIGITSGASGSGNGTVNLTVATNTGAARSGVVTIAGRTYTVTQAAVEATCSYSISATASSAPAVGGTATVGVTASGQCGWTAASQVNWIIVATGASGNGNGNVTLTIAPNTGAERTGVVTIAGRAYTVTQAALLVANPCAFALSSTSHSPAAAVQTVTVNVTTTSGCNWTVASDAAWITVANGAARSGSGAVQLAVAANPGAERVGTVTIAGQTFTITQAPAACTYSLNPTSQSVSLLGGEFSLAVTTQAWCTWSASTEEDWIQLTSAPTGAGNGALTYRVPLVSLGLLFSRTGVITISGQTLTVNQRSLLANEH
jgi:hypothetical protein